MATQIYTLYIQCSQFAYEDVGFGAPGSTDCFTQDDFVRAYASTLFEMLDRIGCTKQIVSLPMQAGVPVYEEPNWTSTVQAVHANNQYCYRDSGNYLGWESATWQLAQGQPFKWKEDGLLPIQVMLTPAPNVDGYQTPTLLPQSGYGTLSSTSTPVDYDIQADSGYSGYGTVSGAPNGAIYLETANQGFGVIASMTSSTGNLQLFESVIPYETVDINLYDYIESLPDQFVPYLKYGILARMFSADSEAKNMNQSAYCDQRYKEGLQLIEAIMSESDEIDYRPPGK